MIGRNRQISEPYAPWSARISLFALILIGAAMLLHRVAVLSTPAAMNLIGVGYILAALALAIGLYAATSIWVRGRAGAWNCAWGLLISGALWLWPAVIATTYMSLPRLNDVTTDMANPPRFSSFKSSVRAPGGNKVLYPGPEYAALQAKAYPDLRTIIIPRPTEDVYELALDLVGGRRGLGWKVIADEPPQTRPARPGTIEATDRSMILGFVDDIVIRVDGTDAEARVDIRSASRYGVHDFGANAARIRRFVKELATRLDAAGPVGVAARGGVRINRADVPGTGVKRPLDRNSTKEDRKR